MALYFKRAKSGRKSMSTEDNKQNSSDWKNKFSDLLNTCQSELKKTTQIGLKMVSASQSNAKLHDTYEALGQWLKQAVDKGDIKIEDTDVQNLLNLVSQLEEELQSYEQDVQDIKKG